MAFLALFWGELFLFTGHIRGWLAVPFGALIGLTMALTGARCRARFLQLFATLYTVLGVFVAYYFVYFGTVLHEVSEHEGHLAADRIPVTLMLEPGFLLAYLSQLKGLFLTSNVAFLAAGLVVSWVVIAVPRARSAS